MLVSRERRDSNVPQNNADPNLKTVRTWGQGQLDRTL
jgi:hypothetical protein